MTNQITYWHEILAAQLDVLHAYNLRICNEYVANKHMSFGMHTSSSQSKVAMQTYIQSIKDGQTKCLTIYVGHLGYSVQINNMLCASS